VDALGAAELDPTHVAGIVRRALDEDLAGGMDVTSVATIPARHHGTADLVARAEGVVAGLPVVAAVFDLVDTITADAYIGSAEEWRDGPDSLAASPIRVSPQVSDGDLVRPGDVLLAVSGPIRALLTAERTALNMVSHLSGVATLTRRWVDAVSGTGAVIRDTRKTLPGLRALEKYAVRCGGGVNHRMSLSEAALVKDNHVAAAGGVAAAFAAVRKAFPGVAVEVECDSVDQVADAVQAGADLILLDNMALADLVRAVQLAKPHGVQLEASGGLTLEGARAVAQTGVDFLAVGALTHSAPALDVGMDLRPGTERDGR